MEGVEQEDWQAERCLASCGNPLLSAEANYRILSKLCGCQARTQLIKRAFRNGRKALFVLFDHDSVLGEIVGSWGYVSDAAAFWDQALCVGRGFKDDVLVARNRCEFPVGVC